MRFLTAFIVLAAISLYAVANADARMAFTVQDEAAITCGDNRDQALAAARELGATVVRINLLEWRTGYCERAYDAPQAVAAAGLTPQLSLAGSAAYMKRMVLTYRDYVSTYGVWNEPDLGVFRCCKAPFIEVRDPYFSKPGNYRKMYTRTYKMIKRNDPGAKVLIGEVSPHGISARYKKPGAKKRTPWLQNVLRKGHPLRADGLAFHPYPWFFSRNGHGSVDKLYVRSMKRIKAMVRGWAKKRMLMLPGKKRRRAVPLYNTEYGMPLWDGRKNDAKLAARSVRYARKLGFRQWNQYMIMGTGGGWDTGLTADCRPTATYYALRKAVTGKRGTTLHWAPCSHPVPPSHPATPDTPDYGQPGYPAPDYAGQS